MSRLAWSMYDVSKRFVPRGLARGPAHLALDSVNLSVAAGERVAIIGESGSGKTTLARVGLGLIPPDSGRIRLLGEDVGGWSKARWRQARSQVQLLFQDPRAMLNPGLSLGALLRESARLHRPDEPAGDLVREALREVGLPGREAARPHELSGGERRRAGLARVLLAKPDLLVADEPTAGLDAGLKADLVALMLDRVGADCAVVLISHDLPMVSWACDRVVVMDQGRVVDEFRAAAVTLHDPHPRTAALLHAAGLRPAPSNGAP